MRKKMKEDEQSEWRAGCERVGWSIRKSKAIGSVNGNMVEEHIGQCDLCARSAERICAKEMA